VPASSIPQTIAGLGEVKALADGARIAGSRL